MVIVPQRAGALLAVVHLLVGCQGDRVGDGEGTGGGSAGSSAGTSGIGGAGTGATGGAGTSGVGGTGTGATGGAGAGGAQTGPGPHGALPSGYCCTTDQDCRYRACLEFGGVKMCSDPCSKESSCNTAANMTCSQATGQCTPTGTPTCRPADQWTLGPYPTGDCCVATNDGHAGEECQGNLCVAFGAIENPFICTQACDAPKDCPPKYECKAATGFCWPLAATYTCQ